MRWADFAEETSAIRHAVWRWKENGAYCLQRNLDRAPPLLQGTLIVIRRATERLTRGMRFRRKLPKAFGCSPIWVSPSAGLAYLFKSMDKIDPVLLGVAMEFVKKKNVVWDIGANVGLFAFSAAYLAGKNGFVVALEADAALVQLLRRSTRIQPAMSAPVRIVPAAVAGSVDLKTFHIASRSRSANFLEGYGSSQIGGTAEEQTVVTISIDWLAERCPLPDILKIDVEGAELEVLNGANKLLDKKRPILLCEVSTEGSLEITQLLLRRGYRIYDGEVCSSQRRELSYAPWCTIAIPG